MGGRTPREHPDIAAWRVDRFPPRDGGREDRADQPANGESDLVY